MGHDRIHALLKQIAVRDLPIDASDLSVGCPELS